MVMQHVREGEEVAHVEEKILLVELVGRVWEKSFFGACVHGRRGQNNLKYRKQSKRMVGKTLVVRYQLYFF